MDRAAASQLIPPVLAILLDLSRQEGAQVSDIVAARRGSFRLRAAAAWAARQSAGLSFPEIGRALGGRHHSTVMHGFCRAEEMRDLDPTFLALTDRLAARSRERLTANGDTQ